MKVLFLSKLSLSFLYNLCKAVHAGTTRDNGSGWHWSCAGERSALLVLLVADCLQSTASQKLHFRVEVITRFSLFSYFGGCTMLVALREYKIHYQIYP